MVEWWHGLQLLTCFALLLQSNKTVSDITCSNNNEYNAAAAAAADDDDDDDDDDVKSSSSESEMSDHSPTSQSLNSNTTAAFTATVSLNTGL